MAGNAEISAGIVLDARRPVIQNRTISTEARMDELTKKVTEAQLNFRRRLLNAAPADKQLTTQAQIAHDLIAIRIMLERAAATRP